MFSVALMCVKPLAEIPFKTMFLQFKNAGTTNVVAILKIRGRFTAVWAQENQMFGGKTFSLLLLPKPFPVHVPLQVSLTKRVFI